MSITISLASLEQIKFFPVSLDKTAKTSCRGISIISISRFKAEENIRTMGIRFRVTGSEVADFDERSIVNAEFLSESPKDSNAKATDYGLGVKVWGRVLYNVGADVDDVLKLAKWSQIPSENADCYRVAEVTVVSAGSVVRKYVIPNAFVVEYSEKADDVNGTGEFYIHIRQKKDNNAKVAVKGGYAGE